ncbi:hypothetical protein IFM89_001816 [Coptis chinensis]|uniref:Glutaredoxin n=1 Tax=Coptis chinensis TaxID=261450 RepID=A0A835HFX7_9MAGN|nr:hypothetical protein IFM89_001816 [Coptis chinensis]
MMVPGSIMRYSTTEPSDQGTHDDFKPTDKDVEENPVMIYMKGIPDAPMCGFSSLAVKVMNTYSKSCHWPTFPQIFINGEFIGGSDIILGMHQSGELKDKLIHLLPKVDKEE